MFKGIKVKSLSDIAKSTPLGGLQVYEVNDAMRTGLTAVGASVRGVKYEPVNTAFTKRFHTINPIDALADRGVNELLASRDHWEISKFFWDNPRKNCKGGVTIGITSPLEEFTTHEVGPHSIEYLWKFNWTGKSSDVERLSVIDCVCNNGMLKKTGLIEERYPHTINRSITPFDANLLGQIKEHLDWKAGLGDVSVDDPRTEAMLIQGNIETLREELVVGNVQAPTYYNWSDSVAKETPSSLHIKPEIGASYMWITNMIDNPDGDSFKVGASESKMFHEALKWSNRQRFARQSTLYSPTEVPSATVNSINKINRAFKAESRLPRWYSNMNSSFSGDKYNMKHVYDLLTREAASEFKTPAASLLTRLNNRIEILAKSQ